MFQFCATIFLAYAAVNWTSYSHFSLVVKALYVLMAIWGAFAFAIEAGYLVKV